MIKKLLVFLRAYNDTDHIIPILYKWGMLEEVAIEIVVTGPPSLLSDYRLSFIRKKTNIRIHHLDEIVSKEVSRQDKRIRVKNTIKLAVRSYVPSTWRNAPRRNSASEPLSQHHLTTATQVLDALMQGVREGVVVFDWTYTLLAQAVTQVARTRGFATVSLPHGAWPYCNIMFTQDQINYDSRIEDTSLYNIYDHTVVPDKITAQDYQHHPDPKRLQILGSPRYNSEWLEILSRMVPRYESSSPTGHLKIVLFLRDKGYPIFEKELVNATRLILQFTEVSLVIKHHTRKSDCQREIDLFAPFLNRGDVQFVGEEVESSALLLWADLVLDLGTSVCYEAVMRRIPVLSLDYLHANYSTLAKYLPSGVVKCRDHLYDAVERLRTATRKGFYNQTERARFIDEVIHYPDSNVLDRYVRFLRTTFRNGHSEFRDTYEEHEASYLTSSRH